MQSTVWTNLPHVVAFIGMGAALHDNDVNATEWAEHEAAWMTYDWTPQIARQTVNVIPRKQALVFAGSIVVKSSHLHQKVSQNFTFNQLLHEVLRIYTKSHKFNVQFARSPTVLFLLQESPSTTEYWWNNTNAVCIAKKLQAENVESFLACGMLQYTQHTHPFNGPFCGTAQVSRYQKGKTNLDFTEARDSEWQ